MRKGFFASVAAISASAGVALGQNYPPTPMSPPGYAVPYGAGAGMQGAPPSGEASFLNNPVGTPGAPMPGGIPPATEMPLNGAVPGPNYPHPINPACQPKVGHFAGQIHGAAGGPDRWYLNLEEQVWWIKGMPFTYPLITSGTPASAGIIGADGTIVKVGNEPFDYGNGFNVLHIEGGLWDCNRRWGVQVGGFVTEYRSQIEQSSLPLNSRFVLARPIINALNDPPLPTSLLVSFPNVFSGSATVTGQFHMGGVEVNAMRALIYCDTVKLNLIGGFRYLDYTEDLLITSTTLFPTAIPELPDATSIADQFLCTNEFAGAQVGFQGEWRSRRLFLGYTGKVAIGNMHQVIDVDGVTQQSVGPITTTTPGGLLAVGSNISHLSRNDFACVTEGSIKLGYQWTQRISTYIGYNGLYTSRVVRPGLQIDPVVNPTLVPVSAQYGLDFPPQRPIPQFRSSEFWAQGLIFGMSMNF